MAEMINRLYGLHCFSTMNTSFNISFLFVTLRIKNDKTMTNASLSYLHTLPFNPQTDSLPALFTYPFHYEPHPLCQRAADLVCKEIQNHPEWKEELEKGKMFGVLVVKTPQNEIGFFAAYSGILLGRNDWSYFVPPVYDLLNPDGFFKKGEEQISALNRQIEELTNDSAYQTDIANLQQAERNAAVALDEAKTALQQAKAIRDQKRQQALSEEEKAVLIKESQYQKAEFKRLEKYWKNHLEECRQKIQSTRQKIDELKLERKQRSAQLQEQLFAQFIFLNAEGQKKDLCRIFREYGRTTPPSGSGECAAPKLLQQAYLTGCQPLAMAEFWWGNSPKDVIRRHGCYYPSCRSKCEPILWHMLQGLHVEPDPLTSGTPRHTVEIIFEDQWLIAVNKPAGMLSVPGKSDLPSVWQWAHEHYPDAQGPLIVHRLDMATSGLLLLAKDKETHQKLQELFEKRIIKKRYIALLENEIRSDKGFIRLPICPNPDERPLQMVSSVYGKPAVTRYEVLARENGHTRVAFYPETGRTHQLRVHAAHPDGLDSPIIGDSLYGTKADRLYLHAESLTFRHPYTGEQLHFHASVPF